MQQVSPMVCDICNHEWVALHDLRTVRLECPKCGYMVQAPPIPTPSNDSDDQSSFVD